uniref:B30.2/SPRY domain-containing protein n=1 Tax=Strombidium rassoulzadegani TaxID=1082188 RepID=A0A7S3CPL6_9SPIT|mmetsp:Transcript_2914/g.4949  ORF Transcript_2914/g.4949 Transcript_2914/m.4949 type:complete len:153 (+) Transcript_2914:179-637(+)
MLRDHSWCSTQGTYVMRNRREQGQPSKYFMEVELQFKFPDTMGTNIAIARQYENYGKAQFSTENSFCLHAFDGNLYSKGVNGRKYFDRELESGDRVGIFFDMEQGTIEFALNGERNGVAFHEEALTEGEYYLTVIQYYMEQECRIVAPQPRQ